jgi:hypothetical protein
MSAGDETLCGILHRLQPFEQCAGDAVEQRFTVIQATVDECLNYASGSIGLQSGCPAVFCRY